MGLPFRDLLFARVAPVSLRSERARDALEPRYQLATVWEATPRDNKKKSPKSHFVRELLSRSREHPKPGHKNRGSPPHRCLGTWKNETLIVTSLPYGAGWISTRLDRVTMARVGRAPSLSPSSVDVWCSWFCTPRAQKRT